MTGVICVSREKFVHHYLLVDFPYMNVEYIGILQSISCFGNMLRVAMDLSIRKGVWTN